jgi:hypothetical protein
MARKALTAVPARTVRAFAHAGRITITDAGMTCVTTGPQGRGRGRLHPDVVAAFNAENGEGLVYDEAAGKPLAGRFVTLNLTKVNKAGAKRTVTEQFPIEQVRKAAGVAGRKGRISESAKATAAQKFSKERGWL